MDTPLLLLGIVYCQGQDKKNSRSGASMAGGFVRHEQEQNRASGGAVPSLNNQLHHNKGRISWTAWNVGFG